jgi:predicted HTH transcriptional regulator
MIAVFPIEELPDVIKEFVLTGRAVSVKSSYEGNVVKATPKPSKRNPINDDRNKILQFIRESGDVGYSEITSADLQITNKSLAYNLKYLADRGDIVRIGEKPYRYKISET